MNRQETQRIYFNKEEQYAAKEIVADVIQDLNFKAVAEEVRTGKQNPVYALKTILNWGNNLKCINTCKYIKYTCWYIKYQIKYSDN